ncbi:MAG: Tim44/TimA family putative adaptor protein [Alphaproteobacteria bacterium]|nr:Tim44/TimA family putative adaptor protein [Alphaproteobacteria bacterium]
MHVDILIFAVIAAFLIYRLNAVLGTRHGDEKTRQNPYVPQDHGQQATHESRVETVDMPRPAIMPPRESDAFSSLIDAKANEGGRVETGLAEIGAADGGFEAHRFVEGAKAAFEMIVTAYAKGDLDTLKPLLSHKLYADFKSGIDDRNAKNHVAETIIHRIKAARIIEAHLGGTMAYVTVDFDVEETTFTKDADGNVIDGDPDKIFSVEDIWTFTRDTRADDPNWILIETRAADA